MIPLEYQTPEPPVPPRRTSALMRFGSGLAIGSLADLVLGSHFAKQDLEVCDLIGMFVWVLICSGLLRIGLAIRERICKTRLCERHGWLSVSMGIVMAGANLLFMNLGAYFFGDKFVSSELFFLPGLMIGSAWVVFSVHVETN